MIQKTRWSPDTCGCELEYEWDDSVAQEDRVHTIVNVVKACLAHALSVNKEKHYTDVLDENQSKNNAIGELVKNLPELKGKESEIKWRINQDRSVTIVLPDEVKSQKIFVETVVDKTKFKKTVSFE